MTKEVTIYTDGACSGNPGAGGYGVVMLYGQHRKEISSAFRKTTNNRMELLAVIVALKALKKPDNLLISVYSDSSYVVNAINLGWLNKWRLNHWKKKSEFIPNHDLWIELNELLNIFKVRFIWVEGHAGVKENERCDELARNAIKTGEFFIDKEYEKKLSNQ
jgi:ribonuclease HI